MHKHSLRAALAALLGLVALLASPLQTIGSTASAATVGTTTTQTTTQFGVSYGERLSRMSQAELDVVLDDAVALGIRWIRIDLSWTTIQPSGPGSYNWAGVDRVVAGAKARGLRVLGILTWTPAWARDPGCTYFACPPRSTTEFSNFAKAAVRRYQPQGVQTWEVWNEPNLSIFWPNPDARRYAALLKAAAKAIRTADPKAFILLGGLSALENAAPSIGPREFLTTVCQAGACGSVNAVSYHPYTFPFTASYLADWSAWSKINQTSWSLRSILNSFGFATKRVWVTEYGAPTDGTGVAADGTWETVLPTTTHVTEGWQASLATDAVQQSVTNPDVDTLFWYTDQDLALSDRREASFGLRRLDGTKKAAWEAYRTAVLNAP